jgi:hypothetical protein
MLDNSVWNVVSNISSSNLTLAVLVITGIVVLIRRTIAQPKPYQLFPVWAILEVALTSYLVPKHGLGQRIL